MKTKIFPQIEVQAFLNGNKTQFRTDKGLKFINQDAKDWRFLEMQDGPLVLVGCDKHDNKIVKEWKGIHPEFYWTDGNKCSPSGYDYTNIFCPFQIGDIIAVMETWGGKYKRANNHQFLYKSDGNDYHNFGTIELIKWRSPATMPKEAAQLFLKVTDVKVQRLNNIQSQDAIAEGIEREIISEDTMLFYKDYSKKGGWYSDPVASYRTLYQSLHPKSTFDNKWVFAVTVEIVKKPENI